MISRAQLLEIMPLAAKYADRYLDFLNDAMDEYAINSPLRQAAFLAQLAHESGELRYVRELASGRAYEGRLDLGNTQAGDGIKYRGRGLIQLTGRHNYQKLSNAFGVDFVTSPELLEEPKWACMSAGWFWGNRNLNAAADVKDFAKITKIINGGYNGYDSRKKYYQRALTALASEPVKETQPMAPFVAAAISELLEAAPDLIRMFGKDGSKVAERNAQAAEKVVEIAKAVTNQPTAEGAVQAIQSDPQLAADFREQVYKQRLELADLAEKSIKDARVFSMSDAPLFWNVRFIHLLSIILILFTGIGGVLVMVGNFSAELKASVVTLMMIGGWNGVKEFWLGSSFGSQRKDEIKGQ